MLKTFLAFGVCIACIGGTSAAEPQLVMAQTAAATKACRLLGLLEWNRGT